MTHDHIASDIPGTGLFHRLAAGAEAHMFSGVLLRGYVLPTHTVPGEHFSVRAATWQR